MGKTREIKKRIKAVANIRRITKTMQMIATSKFSKAQQRALASKPYSRGIFELVTELAASARDTAHPLIRGPRGVQEGAGHLTLVLTSDRGLCGPYNGTILRTAMAHLRSLPEQGPIELVGRKGAGFFRFSRMPVARHHTQFGDTPAYEDVQRLAQDYMDRFVGGQITGVSVVYMRYISAGRQSPEVLTLLPLKAGADMTGPVDPGTQIERGAVYEFSPSVEELLDDLLPEAVKVTLCQCFSDAVVSEHVARMIAMKAATDNAGKMGKALTRQYNRARQAQITTELTEIISGAAALE